MYSTARARFLATELLFTASLCCLGPSDTAAQSQANALNEYRARSAIVYSPQSSLDSPEFNKYAPGTIIANQYKNIGFIVTSKAMIGRDLSYSYLISSAPVTGKSPMSASFIYAATGNKRAVADFDMVLMIEPQIVMEYSPAAAGSLLVEMYGYERIKNATDNSYTWKLRADPVRKVTVGTTGLTTISHHDASHPITNFRITDNSTNYRYFMKSITYTLWDDICGDQRDQIRQSYEDFSINFMPTCANFTQTAHNDIYSYANLTVSNPYKWGLVRLPLTRKDTDPNASSSWGLVSWIAKLKTEESTSFVSRAINSAYRDPQHNSAVGGRTGSRHLFGDAVDLKNASKTLIEYNRMADTARRAHADYVEPTTLPCGLNCVHADWRGHVGAYQD